MSDLPLVPLLGLQGLTIEVLDIGANPAAPGRYASLVDQSLTHVIAIEPASENTAPLLARGADRVLPVFLGDGGPARLHATRDPRFSSLFEPDPAVIDRFTSLATGPGGNLQTVYTAEVQTARLDDVLPDGRPDYILLDIQGGELGALQHGLAMLASAAVIEAETALAALYKDQPLLGDLQCFLRPHGFVLHKLIDVAGRAFLPLSPPNHHEPISQLLWADAVFVRDFGSLASHSDDQLLKAALILNDVYHSFDLALLLLSEHDRRRGTGYGATYHQALQTAPALHPEFLTIKSQP
ncbi:MAG: FkbM family methyltransferase [Proteobacteria bacterium]|nr:FkbM family methyltransferase [Pseudomonadota bacterium]